MYLTQVSYSPNMGIDRFSVQLKINEIKSATQFMGWGRTISLKGFQKKCQRQIEIQTPQIGANAI